VSDENDSQADTSEAEPEARRPAKRKRAPAPAQKAAPAAGLLVVIALAAGGVGAAGGWFGHDAQAKAKLRAESAAPAGSGAPSGSCGAWQKKICTGAGDNSAACAEAKEAVDLLTSPACDAALLSVPATLAKVKAERATCDSLITKLCADLPPGSQACALVREKTPSFPRERCEGMLAHYDEVLGGLRDMDQQMGAAPPPGADPALGAAPQIQMQPAPGAAPAAPAAHP